MANNYDSEDLEEGRPSKRAKEDAYEESVDANEAIEIVLGDSHALAICVKAAQHAHRAPS